MKSNILKKQKKFFYTIYKDFNLLQALVPDKIRWVEANIYILYINWLSQQKVMAQKKLCLVQKKGNFICWWFYSILIPFGVYYILVLSSSASLFVPDYKCFTNCIKLHRSSIPFISLTLIFTREA